MGSMLTRLRRARMSHRHAMHGRMNSSDRPDRTDRGFGRGAFVAIAQRGGAVVGVGRSLRVGRSNQGDRVQTVSIMAGVIAMMTKPRKEMSHRHQDRNEQRNEGHDP